MIGSCREAVRKRRAEKMLSHSCLYIRENAQLPRRSKRLGLSSLATCKVTSFEELVVVSFFTKKHTSNTIVRSMHFRHLQQNILMPFTFVSLSRHFFHKSSWSNTFFCFVVQMGIFPMGNLGRFPQGNPTAIELIALPNPN